MRDLPRLAALAICLASAPAAADYETVAPVRPLTMSDPSGLTVVGLDFQYTKFTLHSQAPAATIDVTALTFDLAADIRVAPHWVLIARVPWSHASTSGDPLLPDCCGLALGNLTVGGRGLWSTIDRTGVRSVLGGELSISAPTANDGGKRVFTAADAGLTQSPHDPGLFAPNVTTIRATLLSQLWSRWFLVQAEAGLQLYLFDGDAPGDPSKVGVRLALGAGVRATYTVSILAELDALVVGADGFVGAEIHNVASVDLGVRYGSRRAIAGVRVYLPVSSALRDLDMLGLGADVGLRF